ncbi:MAG: glycosyltransferase [Deltaproteobacteria bacterium]|nr:glycosyltransferase [Deltaproteobacteria bacterium]
MTYFSVVIPTRGRDECVRQTLRDLGAQDFRDFDIWLVDQNDRPLKDLEVECGGITLHHEIMAPLGSHAGRNQAIFQTTADICIFVDDDVRLERGFLSAYANAYRDDAKRSCISGRVVQPRDGFSEAQMERMGAPARYNKWTGTVSGNFVGSTVAQVQHVHECNFSARAAALRAIGGFNEEFQGNAYFEGADLALRLIGAGFSIEYRPEIVLTHLQDGAGGNRETDKARHTYWFMRNYGLLNSLHMNRVGVGLYGSFGLAYVLAKAAKNADPAIAALGLKGLADGLKYFLPGRKRLRTRGEL